MNLNEHYGLSKSLAGSHSFLSPSKPAWVNYEDEKLDRVFFAAQAAKRGVDLHAFAHEAIRLRRKQIESAEALNLYINDGIGYRMKCEVLLYYSDNAYGHVDCICFRDDTLRVHDLKTGITEASMVQLEIYAALFCLEYLMRPFDIKMELRIYQGRAVKVHEPDPDKIFHLMEKIRYFDKRLNELKKED
jgi:hypothetical protein